MNCWFCNGEKELMWNCDYTFEDFGVESDGIVTVLTCPNCNASFEGYLPLNNEEEVSE